MGMSSGSSKSKMAISEINVTPLVDVMLVLLIMFMVTAPMMQQGIEVDLPKTSSSGVELNEDPFVLTIDSKGVIKAANQTLKMNALRDKMKSIFGQRKNKQLYIQADKSVNYGVVAEVMAELRAAGIYNIGLITIPKTDAAQ